MQRLQSIIRTGLLLLSVIVLMTFDIGLAAEKDNKPIQEAAGNSEISVVAENEDQGFIYDPRDKTDPFQSFIAAAEEKEEEEKRKPKTYLETLELSQLDLAATIIGPKGRWAIVRDSKDDGHVIKEGTLIGTNGGEVYKINEGEVIIREKYRDFRGQMQHREISKKTPSTTTVVE